MDSRERTFLALDHQRADRLPIDFWASPGVVANLEARLGTTYPAFLDRYDVDLRYIAGPRYMGPPLGAGRDIWGVLRRSVEVPTAHGAERYSEVAESPLAFAADPDDVAAYALWPSADAFDYSPVAAQCRAIRDAGRVVVFMGDRLNRVAQLKPAMYLRGVEQILLDLALAPEIADAILGRIRAFYLAYLERVLDAAEGLIDIVLTGDDFGAQNGLLVSPAAWRTFLGDGFAEYVALIHSHGALAMHHTCGAVSALIPDLIARGLDVLQSLQPEAVGMEPEGLVERFGERLCFHGGLSIQRTLPYGTPADIRREVQRVATAGKVRGGYILCTAHNIQADTSVENILALLDAYHEFERY